MAFFFHEKITDLLLLLHIVDLRLREVFLEFQLATSNEYVDIFCKNKDLFKLNYFK